MRTHLLGFIGALAFLVGLQTADAAPSVPNGSTLASPPTVLPVKHHCGKGQRWIPARDGEIPSGPLCSGFAECIEYHAIIVTLRCWSRTHS